MNKIFYLLLPSCVFCFGFLGFFEDDVVNPSKIYCTYGSSNPTPSAGISEAMEGYSTGNDKVDAFNTIIGALDDLQGMYTTHSFSCSYSKNGIPDKKFAKQISKGLIKYIIFYNGLVSRYFRIFNTTSVNESTLKPKIDYVGLLDKDNNLIAIFAPDAGGGLSPLSQKQLDTLSKYKPE